MNAPAGLPSSMTVAEFLSWSDDQASGRYELIDGAVVAMAPERVAHARRKLEICDALRAAIAASGVGCETFIDGIGVAVDGRSVLIPDVLVHCGEKLDGDAMVAPDPLIIVEVLSPSTRAIDLNAKLGRYFQLPSVAHYLIAHTNTPATLHYRRTPDGISLQIASGVLRLDPPGITINLD